ncbi:malto-oligosyltrehalose trehalohydrolase [Dyella mobilis]|uniref:Malto-oligosyltrehalose trehalohydrolase n=1 Tax=Dyella mobilis TaxID=1849582 RepID=A0ABS2KCD3_9GAMM|nr:malto-oligosyltrehalose trehalohydrolase [Dyella mobilis]MBM7128846.1 malto-oligosyltrehalose trehalohydrolase [Dyella mobilis]GLQ99177.1 malto-oligosyltrehalose trehalohydrolase [Dyella mobilis]
MDIARAEDIAVGLGSTYGAIVIDAVHVRFCLWAPDAERVDLVIGHVLHPMLPDSDGNYTLIVQAKAGTSYCYLINGEHRIPDPASRAQPAGVHCASVVADPSDYLWQQSDWQGLPWHRAIICELHVGAMGGFDGVRQLLPRLAACGYTAIELMPIGSFEGERNWGYDGVLPYAPDASYGTPASLKAMIDEAHRLGLAVILDVVYNHFGPVGNYLPLYASLFFRPELQTPWGAAIDFRKPQVARYFIDNALMWLHDYRFDGLRLDAVHAIKPKTFLDELGSAIRKSCAAGREVFLIVENEANRAGLLRADYDAQWNDDAHNALHVMLTGEHEGYYADFQADPTDSVACALSEGFVFQGQPDRRGIRRGEPSRDLAPASFVLFLQNHDQIGNRPMGERLASLIAEDDLRAVTVLAALSPMVPLFFMGEEWGCRTPFFYFTDYQDELAERVREGRRREFAHFSGFTDPASRLLIPDPNAEGTFEASVPRVENPTLARTWIRWFEHLLYLRKEHLCGRLALSRSLGTTVLAERALLARWRLADGCIWEIALNVSPRDVAWHRSDGARIIWSEPPDAAGRQEILPAHSAMVLASEMRDDDFDA